MCSKANLALILIVVTCLISGTVLSSCSKKGREEAKQVTTMASAGGSRDSLGVTISLNAGSYAIREHIVMTVTAVNTTERALRLTFPTAQRYDFIVRKDRKPIWRWSDDRMFAQALSRHTIEPGDSIVYEFEWDQANVDGTELNLGRYTVGGILKTLPERASREKTFSIAD
jgi:hypothetical protein